MLSCIKDCTVVLRDPSVAKVHLDEGQLETICLGHLVNPWWGWSDQKWTFCWSKAPLVITGDPPQSAASEEEHDLSS